MNYIKEKNQEEIKSKMKKIATKKAKKVAKEKPFLRIYITIIIFFIIIISFKLSTSDRINNISIYINSNQINIERRIENINNEYYMSFEDIKKLDKSATYIKKDKNIILGNKKIIARFKVGSKEYELNGQKYLLQDAIKEDKRIPINVLAKIYNMEMEMEIVKYANPNTNSKIYTNIFLYDLDKEKKIIEFKNIKDIYQKNGIFLGKVSQTKENENLIYIGEDKKYIEILSKSGIRGYVKNSDVKKIITIRNNKNVQKEKLNFILNYDDPTLNYDNVKFDENTKNAIVFTNFKISNEMKNIYSNKSSAFKEYKKRIDEKGAILFGKVFVNEEDNYFVLSKIINYEGRRDIISKIIKDVKDYDLKGIYLNINYKKDVAAYIRFVYELKIRLKEENIYLAIPKDVKEELAKRIVDYMIEE